MSELNDLYHYHIPEEEPPEVLDGQLFLDGMGDEAVPAPAEAEKAGEPAPEEAAAGTAEAVPAETAEAVPSGETGASPAVVPDAAGAVPAGETGASPAVAPETAEAVPSGETGASPAVVPEAAGAVPAEKAEASMAEKAAAKAGNKAPAKKPVNGVPGGPKASGNSQANSHARQNNPSAVQARSPSLNTGEASDGTASGASVKTQGTVKPSAKPVNSSPSAKPVAKAPSAKASAAPAPAAPDAPTAKKKSKLRFLWWLIPLVLVLFLAVAAGVSYSRVFPIAKMELGNSVPDASAFMRDGSPAVYVRSTDVALTEEGRYLFVVKTDGLLLPVPVLLETQDTVAPSGVVSDLRIVPGEPVAAEDAVSHVSDASAVTISWRDEPDWNTAGTYETAIVLTDLYGNSTELPFTVVVSAVVPTLTMEAGDPLPDASLWLMSDKFTCTWTTGYASLDLCAPGTYDVTVTAGGVPYKVQLIIEDTTAPAFTLVSDELTVVGVLPDPASLVEEPEDGTVIDATEVTYTYTEEPDVSAPGTVTVSVTGTDTSGNFSVQETALEVCDYIIPLEASSKAVTASGALATLGLKAASGTGNNELLPAGYLGDCMLDVESTSGTLRIGFHVTDTVAPTAEGISRDWYACYPLDALDLVKNVKDATECTGSYIEEPDWGNEGSYVARILVTDAAGNTCTVTSEISLAADTEAPVIISGRTVHSFYIGDAVSYNKEITVSDNVDTDLKIDIDKSQVNPREEGEYPVTYTVTDNAGNSSTVTMTFAFVEQKVTMDELQPLIDKLLKKVTYSGMSTAQKIEAVYQYLWDNVPCSGTSNKNDPIYEAYRALNSLQGDCFSVNSVLKFVVEQLGGEAMWVERIGSTVNHYWIMVNIGTGWYHIDAYNHNGPRDYRVLFATTQELKAFKYGYWRYDEASYPTAATREFYDSHRPDHDYAYEREWDENNEELDPNADDYEERKAAAEAAKNGTSTGGSTGTDTGDTGGTEDTGDTGGTGETGGGTDTGTETPG